MRLKFNELLAVVYGDIFDWPLTGKEARLWAVNKDLQGLAADRRGFKGNGLVHEKDSYVFLRGREKLVKLRKRREEISKKKLMAAIKLVRVIKLIPTVEGIFVTGSVAAGNAKEDSDIDLLIATSAGTLWMTRALLVGFLKLLGLYRGEKNVQDRVCTNIFLDRDHLGIEKRNLYTAHEVLLAKCLFDRTGVQQEWLRRNSWIKNYLLNAYRTSKGGDRIFFGKKLGALIICLRILIFLPELVAFSLQHWYMKGKITNEEISMGYAFFHPKDLSLVVSQKFDRRLNDLLLGGGSAGQF